MRLDQFLALETDVLLVSIRPGRISDLDYAAGTIGRISKTLRLDEPPEIIIHFTRTLIFDFARFEKKNWEILSRCSRCAVLEIGLSKCSHCNRPDYCAACLQNHVCHIPLIGVSRLPRREKLCYSNQK